MAVYAQRTKLEPSGAGGAAGGRCPFGSWPSRRPPCWCRASLDNSLRKRRPPIAATGVAHPARRAPARGAATSSCRSSRPLAEPLLGRREERSIRPGHATTTRIVTPCMSDSSGRQPERQGSILEADAFARALPAGARLMGLDLGTKTLGLALSDVTRTIASGLATLSRSKFSADARQLLELASRHDVGGFVIGLPINLDGSSGPRAQATRAFARNLSKLDAHAHPLLGRAPVDGSSRAHAARGRSVAAPQGQGRRQGGGDADPAKRPRPAQAIHFGVNGSPATELPPETFANESSAALPRDCRHRMASIRLATARDTDP